MSTDPLYPLLEDNRVILRYLDARAPVWGVPLGVDGRREDGQMSGRG